MSAPVQNDDAKAQDTQLGFSFAPERLVNLIFPSLEFLPGRVLGILLTWRRYTHNDSLIELGHSRLADSIWKLNRLGWDVQRDDELVKTRDFGRSATIGVYFLRPQVIAAAGERGRLYAVEAARIEAERRAA